MTQHHVLNYPWHMTRLAMELIKRGDIHTPLPLPRRASKGYERAVDYSCDDTPPTEDVFDYEGNLTHYDHSMYRKGSVCISTTRYLRNPGLISVPITSSEMEFWRRVLGS